MDKPVVPGSVVFSEGLAMCDDLGCPSRKNCYRHSASGRLPRANKQSYFAVPTRSKGDASCPWFWPVRPPGEQRPRVRRVTVVEQFTIRNDPSQMKMYLDRTGVATMLGVQPSTIGRLMRRKDIDFPQPMKLGNKIMHWLRAEVEQFMQRDEMRGVGVRSTRTNPWIGSTPDMPAYPWVWTTAQKENSDGEDQSRSEQKEEDQAEEGGNPQAREQRDPGAGDFTPTFD